MTASSDAERALVLLGRMLRDAGYRFVAVTPETHRRVNARANAANALDARSLRDVFGWSRAFDEGLLAPPMMALLRAADALEACHGKLRSRVRYATLDGAIYVHSAYPTTHETAVFFGPDTYRFCSLLAREMRREKDGPRRVVDVGCGSGAGGLSIADAAASVVLADINHAALSFARVNAELAGVASKIEICVSDVLAGVTGTIDAVIANPPYMIDEARRAYRDGGEDHGTALALRIVRESLARLDSRGRLVLYTGAPIVDGVDVFLRAARPLLDAAGAEWTYGEIDPDVFGEELEAPAYAAVERISVVALSAAMPDDAVTRRLDRAGRTPKVS